MDLPGDKSISHRAALLGVLAEGESRLDNFLVAGVTQPTLIALSSLGVAFDLTGTTLTIQGVGIEGLHSDPGSTPADGTVVQIDCGNSATNLRLLAGILAAAGRPAVLDGSPGLRRRPMQRIITPLARMGVPIASVNGCAPLRLFPEKQFAARANLLLIYYELQVASAQVKSCILLAALAADGETTLVEPGPSRDHTERLLRGMGISIQSEYQERQAAGGISRLYLTHLNPSSPFHVPPLRLAIPGDFSAAAFLMVASLVTPGSELTLANVGLNPTRTGLLDVARAMGAEIQINNLYERNGEPVGDVHVRYSRLSGVEVSGELVVRMIDEFPIFAVAAACAVGLSRVRDAQELREKESDRISALCSGLRTLGVQALETEDGFCILGRAKIAGGEVDPAGDHRLAMAFAVAGLAASAKVVVLDAEYIAESYPRFIEALTQLGANLEVQE